MNRRVGLAVGALGVMAVMTQLALMREMLCVFSGNELALGVILGNWLLLTGLGSWLGRTAGRVRHPGRTLALLLLFVALLPLAEVFTLRELRNVVERMAILTAGERLPRESIPVEVRVQRETSAKSTIQEARESAEREHIMRALEETNWNVSGAARALGMERTNLHKRIRALGLSRGR